MNSHVNFNGLLCPADLIEFEGKRWKHKNVNSHVLALINSDDDKEVSTVSRTDLARLASQGKAAVIRASVLSIADRARLTEEVVAEGERRLAYCQAMDANEKPTSRPNVRRVIRVVSKELNDACPPSVPTANRWFGLYRKHGGAGLFPQRPGRPYGEAGSTRSEAHDDLIDRVIDERWLAPNRPTVESCFAAYKEEMRRELPDEELISRQTFHRLVGKVPAKKREASRGSKETAAHNERTYGDEHEYTRFGERVEADAMKIFIGMWNDLVWDEPVEEARIDKVFLYTVVDRASHSMLGYHVDYEADGETALGVMKSIIKAVLPKKNPGYLPHGLFETFRCDNGSAYKSTDVRLFLSRVTSSVSASVVNAPWNKPLVETVNKTLRVQLFRNMRTYIPKRDNETKSQRQVKDIPLKDLMPLSEFLRRLEDYIVLQYQKTGRVALKGKSPDEVLMELWAQHPPMVADDVEGLSALKPAITHRTPDATGNIRVRNQVFTCPGFKDRLDRANHYRSGVNHMGDRKYKTVEVFFDPDDASEITVISPDNREFLRFRNRASSVAKETPFASLDKLLRYYEQNLTQPPHIDMPDKKSKSGAKQRKRRRLEEKLSTRSVTAARQDGGAGYSDRLGADFPDED